ncbi:MAG: hypothetical protein Q4D38_08115 [Planctomycetia bacterium]|nr:hypothetical protein [Planctomycetia bacterium]
MIFKDRIKELRRVKTADLKPNEKNWRLHPEAQKNALRGVLEEVGYADALLAREDENGNLILLDGHLRAEITPDQVVPVLVLDVSEEEGNLILATLDPLAAMAENDNQKFEDLFQNLETQSDAVRDLLQKECSQQKNSVLGAGVLEKAEILIPEIFQVVVECESEEHQAQVYTDLESRGLKCRLLNM